MDLVCACFKRFFFCSYQHFILDQKFPPGRSSYHTSIQSFCNGMFSSYRTARSHFLSRGNCGQTLSRLIPVQNIWYMKTVHPKMRNPSLTFLVLHIFAFIIWEDGLPGWRFGFSETRGQKCNDCTSDQHSQEENSTNMPNSKWGLGHTMPATCFLSLNVAFHFSSSPKLG